MVSSSPPAPASPSTTVIVSPSLSLDELQLSFTSGPRKTPWKRKIGIKGDTWSGPRNRESGSLVNHKFTDKIVFSIHPVISFAPLEDEDEAAFLTTMVKLAVATPAGLAAEQ